MTYAVTYCQRVSPLLGMNSCKPGSLAPKDPPDFARPEYGFHLRDAAEWDALCRGARFVTVNVETLQFKQITANGPTKRHTLRVTARA